jgi:hypothetical protein
MAAANTASRQLFYAVPFNGHLGESSDSNNLALEMTYVLAAPEHVTPDGNHVSYAQVPSKATNSGSRRPTVMSQPDRRPGNGTTLSNDAFTGPRHLQRQWNGHECEQADGAHRQRRGEAVWLCL